MRATPEFHMPDDAAVEIMARSIHEDYLSSLAERDLTIPTHRAWDDLAGDAQELNRNQARDNVVKLDRAGIAVVAEVDDSFDVIDQLPEELVERMARDEHRRWVAQRTEQGYQYGPERCDDPPDLRHPDMVAWADLPDEVREKDRRPIRMIPVHLGAAGLHMVRR